MPVELGPKFRPDWQGIPPHVSSEDLVLWERFRREAPGTYAALYFDVALGEGEEAPPGTPLAVAEAWRRLTRFRADVVGERREGWDIVELRPNAGPGAIGALQVYTTLWGVGPPDGRPVRAILVTDRCVEDVQTVARLAGIDVRCLLA